MAEDPYYLTSTDLTLGDGITRTQALANTASVNSISATLAAEGKNRPLVFPAGITMFAVDGTNPYLYWRSKVPFVGRGREVTTLKFHGSHSANFFIFTGNTSRSSPFRNLAIRDLTIDMNRANQTAGGNMALLSGYVIDREDTNILIKNVDGPGVYGLIPQGNGTGADWGTQGSYGGQTQPANRPDLSGSMFSENVRLNRVTVDGTGQTGAGDLCGFGGIDGLYADGVEIIGGRSAGIAVYGSRRVFLDNFVLKGCKFGGYMESNRMMQIRGWVVEGVTQASGDLAETLPMAGVWICSLDETYGVVPGDYDACVDVVIDGLICRDLTRIQPGSGNTTAGGVCGVLLSGRSPSHPVRMVKVVDCEFDRVRALAAAQSPAQGSATAKGYGIRVAGSAAEVDLDNNRFADCDQAIDLGDTWQGISGSAGLMYVSVMHNRIRGCANGIRWHDTTVNACAAKDNEFYSVSGTKYAETSLTGSLTVGGTGNQIDHG
ncbi:MAG TPA: hypothetical protein VF744_13770 [Beijerinckiaceae bacterium]